MKVLLTGATGYLGSCLIPALLNRGHQVLALKRSFSDLGRIQNYLSRLTLVDGDRMDPSAVLRDCGKVDALILGATCYGRDGEPASRLVESNLWQPLQLLEAALDAQIPSVLNIASSLPPEVSPYALSKDQFVRWAKLVTGSHPVRFVNARVEHFYGPEDNADKFPMQVIRRCLHNQAEIPLTAGAQRRDFIYVDDVVAALICLLERAPGWPAGWRDIPVGSGKAVTVRQFAELVRALSGSTTHLKFGEIPYREHEIMNSVADIAFLESMGWSPRVTLEEGLRLTIAAERKREAT